MALVNWQNSVSVEITVDPDFPEPKSIYYDFGLQAANTNTNPSTRTPIHTLHYVRTNLAIQHTECVQKLAKKSFFVHSCYCRLMMM